jgi:hypothetical protein
MTTKAMIALTMCEFFIGEFVLRRGYQGRLRSDPGDVVNTPPSAVPVRDATALGELLELLVRVRVAERAPTEAADGANLTVIVAELPAAMASGHVAAPPLIAVIVKSVAFVPAMLPAVIDIVPVPVLFTVSAATELVDPP